MAAKWNRADWAPYVITVVIVVTVITSRSVPADWPYWKATLAGLAGGAVALVLAYALIALRDRRRSS